MVFCCFDVMIQCMYCCIFLLALQRAASRESQGVRRRSKDCVFFNRKQFYLIFKKNPDSSLLTPDVNNILPEVCVECCAEADYYEGTDNIEGTPTLTDRLLEV